MPFGVAEGGVENAENAGERQHLTWQLARRRARTSISILAHLINGRETTS